MSATKILKKIELLKKQVNSIQSMRSGSLSEQYSICGSPGCKCKDVVSPKKHGPYFKLRINVAGKNTTKFIKPEDVKKVKNQLAEYKVFKGLVGEWIRLADELADLEIVGKSIKQKWFV